jgi:type IV secretion system protein VirD4
MKNRPMTVYLILPPRYLETHATWLRLMLTAILIPLLRTTGGDVPVLFMLDEFAQLGRLEVIERNMALMRGYGVKLWTIFQDLAQAKDIYERRWESFISNAGVRHVFAPQDVTTQEYFSKLSGQRIYWLKTTGTNTGQSMGPQSSISSGVTEGWTNIQGPAYWPQSLAAMETGKAVLFGKDGPTRTWRPNGGGRPRECFIAARSSRRSARLQRSKPPVGGHTPSPRPAKIRRLG